MDAAHAGGLGGTFGGSPTAVAAGVAVLEQIEEGGWLERAAAIGELLTARLTDLQAQYPIIGDVRGKGAMIAIELVEAGTKTPNSKAADALVSHCHQNGVLILNAGTYNNVIRFLPPLAITNDLLNDALDVLAEGFAKL
jgi:4-aminobutyrate aminotransferase/(S)-3-amino-2-methylpropionate transaminase